MENPPSLRIDVLRDLETQQEDLLKRLDFLDKQVESVLADCLAARQQEQAQEGGPPDSTDGRPE